MSPKDISKLSDHESETGSARIGRPPVDPQLILTAADALLTETGPQEVTMEAIAVAAGVGKGTLFRAFESRDGLLEALWTGKLTALRTAVEEGEAPLGPGTPPRQRIVAFLDALLTFKLENRHLIRMREHNSAGIRQSKNYKWTHGLLTSMIKDAAPQTTADDAGYAAHALLAALDINLVDELLATGHSLKDIRRSQAAVARAVIDSTQNTKSTSGHQESPAV